MPKYRPNLPQLQDHLFLTDSGLETTLVFHQQRDLPGNPLELGAQYAELRTRFPHINVLGGCCGTDLRHIDHIASACLAAAPLVAQGAE